MSGFILFAVIMRENLVFARAQPSRVPLKELSHVKLRRLTREQISNNIPKLMYFVMLVNIHVNTTAKGNPIKQ